MKKKIEQLLNGRFVYEQPQLLFSRERLTIALKAGETVRGEVYVGTENNERIRGYITSSHRRMVPGVGRFSGTTVCIPFGADAAGMGPGETCAGWLCFTTNIGEYKLPFSIETEPEAVRTSEGKVEDLDGFAEIARQDFKGAFRLFTEKSFPTVMKDAQTSQKAMYDGLSRQPVTYQHMEEFLIGTGRKEAVRIGLQSPEGSFYDVEQSVQESFVIVRSGWGHLRLELEVRGNFLEIGRHVITDEDFIGSRYEMDFVIRREKLGRGRQIGEIVVRSPYQELRYRVTASGGPDVRVNVSGDEKRRKLTLVRDYLSWRMGRLGFAAWIKKSREILAGMKGAGSDYPEYQMYEAYLLHLEEKDEEASEILRSYGDKSFTKKDLEFAGVYLYLCTLTGLYSDREQALRRIQNFYMQKEDSLVLLWVLLQMDETYRVTPSKALFAMEDQFDRGCHSPVIYLEAWQRISRDMSLLHRLSRFWVQVFLYAGKEGLLTSELVMRFAYLSGYERTYSESLYRALTLGYRAFPTDDTLEAVCRYIMQGNPRRPEYFPWFSEAVARGIRLTRLYEYYIETMDASYQRELPKPLLMYFTYNSNTLGDGRKAFIYASVISHKNTDPQTYEDYRDNMKAFAREKLMQGRMDENYAALYQEFLTDPHTPEEARAIAGKMFTCRLYCDDKKIRQVIVRHHQMAQEEIYPCVQGVAYPRLYTEDAVILFQDEKQRRYTATVAYNVSRLMDERELVEKVAALCGDEPGVLLHYFENTEISRENLELCQKLAGSEAFTEEYRQSVRRKILEYYTQHAAGEDLDDYLRNMDYGEYIRVDRKALLEILIVRRLFSQAFSLIAEYGCEGVELTALLKLTSRMILKCDMAEDDDLLALASQVYRMGKYDEVILRYLMLYRFGPMDDLFAIWKSARGFDMDTYDLEERMLGLLIFTSDYRKDGEEVLKDYVRHSGKERIIGAYLTQVSYGVFVREYSMSPFIRQCLENAYNKKWPVNRVCRLALLKELSKGRDHRGRHLEMEKELLRECAGEGLVFAFYRRLPPQLLSPYQLDDKTFVEYHAGPSAKVLLVYALDTGLGMELEYRTEPLQDCYEGIFTKTFTLFYGETLHYHFQVEKDGRTVRTPERVLTMNRVLGAPGSRYRMLNQILSARRLGKEQEAISGLKEYLRREQYVKEMFKPIRED